MIRVVAAAVVCLALAACEGKPLAQAQTENAEFQVAFLFEHDGCRVYRFRDAGYRHYFTDCRGSTATTHARLIGKTYVNEPEEIQSTGRDQ